MILIKSDRKLQSAFTLVELLIVIAIIGILASIAYPSYQDSVRKSRRSDAKGALMGFANAMERHFTARNSYCDAGGGAGTGTNTCFAGPVETNVNDSGIPIVFSTTSPVDGTTAYYNLTIVTATATTYNLRATPTGAQVGDGLLEINQTESKGRWDRNNDGDTADAGEATWD